MGGGNGGGQGKRPGWGRVARRGGVSGDAGRRGKGWARVGELEWPSSRIVSGKFKNTSEIVRHDGVI